MTAIVARCFALRVHKCLPCKGSVMAIRSFTGYLNTDLFGTENPSGTFTIDPADEILILFQDGDTDLVVEGDSDAGSASTEDTEDPQGDQLAFVLDSSGVAVIDGVAVYLESSFVFEIGGQQFTGYHFEEDNGAGSVDFTILPPNLPAGTATVISVDFTLSPDEVPYNYLASGDEEINASDFSNLNLGGADTIITGDGDDTITSGGGADTINSGAGEDIINSGGGADTIDSGSERDIINAGGGADTVNAGYGNDVVDGGNGNDIIRGDSGDNTTNTDYANIPDPDGGTTGVDDGDDLSGGFTVDAGSADVGFTFVDSTTAPNPSNAIFEFNSDEQQYTEGLNNGIGNSDNAIYLEGTGGIGETSTTNITFVANDPNFNNAVENVNFRINDIDDALWQDVVTIRAFDADDNEIIVNLTAGANMTLSDTTNDGNVDTATAIDGTGNQDSATAEASLLVEIPGPVARIEIDYGNLGTGGQRIDITEIYFDPIPVDDPVGEFNDILSGGGGSDQIFGEFGNDILDGGNGQDTLDGGVGDDTILISNGRDTIDGGAGDDTFDAFQPNSSLPNSTITVIVDNNGTGTIAKSGGTPDSVTSVETYIADEDTPENDRITLTDTTLTAADISGIDDNAVGTYTSTNGNIVVSFGGPGQPTLSQILAGTAVVGGVTLSGTGSFQITDGDESGTIGNINFENFENIDFTIVCFAAGTLITTDTGDRRVEDLQTGDKVMTADNGLQALRWTGARHLDAAMLQANPKLRPIRIQAGALADGMPKRDLIVSPQHRILVRSNIAIRMFDAAEVFVPAKHLLDLPGVSIASDMDAVTYVHIMCNDHEVISAEGALAETLYTGTQALKAMSVDARAEIDAIFGNAPYLNRPLARVTPQGSRARQLINRHVKNQKQVYQGHI